MIMIFALVCCISFDASVWWYLAMIVCLMLDAEMVV